MRGTVAEAFALSLKELGVRHAFGVSGGAISFFWSALGSTGVDVTHFRHETGAAFAACEASLATKTPIVVFVTTGPGLTNVLTGMYASRHEAAQVILVSAHTDESMQGRQSIQETGPLTLPQEGVFTAGPLFDYAAKVTSSKQLPSVIDALSEGMTRPGGFVAHISLSLSVQRQIGSLATPSPMAPHPTVVRAPGHAVEAYQRLRAGNFVIWAGGGARCSAASVRRLMRAAAVPVMVTPRGKGVIPETDPSYLGVTGFAGHASVLSYLESVRPEHILVLGSGLGDFASGYLPGYLPASTFVHVDVNPAVHGKAYPAAATMPVTAEVGVFCEALADLFEAAPTQAAPGGFALNLEELPADRDRIHPGRVVDAVQSVFVDADVPVMAETGNTLAWAINRLRLPDPSQWRAPSGLVGSMGHFACGVVGAAVASSGKVVALVGDGAMLMSNEVSTAVHRGTNAIWIVFNDSCYNMCHQGAAALGLTHVECAIPKTDFADLARALGAGGSTVRSADELESALNAALTATGPVVVDVHIDPAWPAPTKGRNAGLLRDTITSRPQSTLAYAPDAFRSSKAGPREPGRCR
jgi:acetolactate synthase-1/2/3 large subunit